MQNRSFGVGTGRAAGAVPAERYRLAVGAAGLHRQPDVRLVVGGVLAAGHPLGAGRVLRCAGRREYAARLVSA
ncbi:hypothetical protein D3C79_1073190 [compost metagenome]